MDDDPLDAASATAIRHALEALAHVELESRLMVDQRTAELCRLRVAQLLRHVTEQERVQHGSHLATADRENLRQWPTSPRYDGATRSCLALAEQFVVDPAGVDQGAIDAVLEHMSVEHLVSFLRFVQATEARQRTELTLRHDPELAEWTCAAAAIAVGSAS